MSEDPENLVLVYLRRIDERLEHVVEDVRDLKTRATTVEQQIASLAATIAGNYASTSSRLDRLENRIERIERRLDLHDGPPAAAE